MSFLDNIETEKVNNLLKDTQSNVDYFQGVTDGVVESYTKDLDDIMLKVYQNVVSCDDCDIYTIEHYYLELTNCLYFTSSELEKLGIYDSMSKSAYKEIYNRAYLGNQDKDGEKRNKTTVAENTAVAENASIYESAVNDIYNKAYRIVKTKIDNAQIMIQCLGKVMNHRISENNLVAYNPQHDKRLLNEQWQDQGGY